MEENVEGSGLLGAGWELSAQEAKGFALRKEKENFSLVTALMCDRVSQQL